MASTQVIAGRVADPNGPRTVDRCHVAPPSRETSTTAVLWSGLTAPAATHSEAVGQATLMMASPGGNPALAQCMPPSVVVTRLLYDGSEGPEFGSTPGA